MNHDQFIKYHFTQALRSIVQLSQKIDQLWDCEGHQERLADLRQILEWCGEHPHQLVKELQRHERLVHEHISRDHFLGILVPLERNHSRGVVDHDLELVEGDRPIPQESSTLPVYVIMDNIRSAFNVGSAFRTCECFGVRKLYLCGYTATPENDKTRKTAMGTSDLVPWEHFKTSHEAIKKLQDEGIRVYALETASNAENLYQASLTGPIGIVVGNERHGMNPSVIKACDGVIQIPLRGRKNSLNVGVALGTTLGEVLRQHQGSNPTQL
ncbi:RNA methyltransferase [Pseudobacteriovorax antillogorgiicola]|uniref:tRNA G18 (Ribose-2'-O)-methylase SpoU n=1 Tax=Pseudobacteriovorax antillogorgiicola TaxID=1513793 RepID=A0A1Y6CBR4_9BACT|nr:RNA methyltransferase [Pseudobacteriovorax antillogorgiicola]TCS49441.1 tRNA G18 (ribose-2'-O)-methylase SpoU [Pseudobacteriovorax antillogorgiicola]SMF46591.1 tRNA G18 (ribose-2'-O)-methylase SpoU [Pseudobacteriovorax antillogorgiicola]